MCTLRFIGAQQCVYNQSVFLFPVKPQIINETNQTKLDQVTQSAFWKRSTKRLTSNVIIK